MLNIIYLLFLQNKNYTVVMDFNRNRQQQQKKNSANGANLTPPPLLAVVALPNGNRVIATYKIVRRTHTPLFALTYVGTQTLKPAFLQYHL
jgi:hypothetical protein